MAPVLMVGTDRTPPIVVMARPLTMPCPTCGGDALWQWVRPDVVATATDYPSVDCPVCDIPDAWSAP